jgi:hypothetical protein
MTPEEKRKEYRKQYDILNKEKIAKQKKELYLANKEKVRQQQKEYQNNNREVLQRKQTEKLLNDPNHKLKVNTRNLINNSFKNSGFKKLSRTEQIIGCSYEEFKIYLESKFEPWMSWENKGNPKDGILEINKTWDIDHIIPLSTATCEADIIKLNHYTNLQPMCSYTNRFIKRDTIN